MADLIFNTALGRAVQWADNVELNSPVGAVLRMHAWISTAADDDINNQDVISELQALALSAEATLGGYTNQSWIAADLTITVNDATNLVDIDSVDITWTGITAGDVWSHVSICYDGPGTDVDTTNQLISNHVFIVTPNGGDITAQFAAAGWFQAT